jgi:hypothetical protein
LSPKILVIRLSSLGDVVLTGPVYKSLKAHWPACRVTVLVKPQFAAALKGHPGVDEVVPFTGVMDAVRLIRNGASTCSTSRQPALLRDPDFGEVPHTATYSEERAGSAAVRGPAGLHAGPAAPYRGPLP